MRIDWNEYFMGLAKLAATRSGCNSRPTGAVIVKGRRVIATGYNGSLPGTFQCTDQGPEYCHRRNIGIDDTGEKKYSECPAVHAEQNAINQVARCGGVKLEGAKMYCTLQPCIFCLKNMVSVGIREVFYEHPYNSNDPLRDSYWADALVRYKVEARHIVLSAESVKKLVSSFSTITSIRRL